MNLDAEVLARELRRLWQREGTRSPQRWHSLDPQLAQVFRITELDGPTKMRQKAAKAVDRFLPQPEETKSGPQEKPPKEVPLKDVLLAALALDPLADQDTLKKRLREFGQRRFIGGVRTVRRRLNDAVKVFVEAAITEERAMSAAGGVGYVVEDFDATVTTNGDKIKIIERRRIKSTRDQLDAVRCCLRVRQAPDEDDEHAFRVDVISGGPVRDVNRQPEAIEVWIELPEPLGEGQLHEFEVRYEFPMALLIGPYYVVQPVTPFETVAMTVRFDPCRVPARVRRFDGVMPPHVDRCPADGEELSLDPSACVRATFRDVRAGRAYGIRWDWT